MVPPVRYEARWNPDAGAYAVYDCQLERWADMSPTDSERTAQTVAESLNLLERVERLKAAARSPGTAGPDDRPAHGLRPDR